MVTATQPIIQQSIKNNSLVLKSFIPMCITNKKAKEGARTYSYEFKPGMYQLTGLNGVGKTTLLKALGIPKGILTEFSCGQAALQGAPLFDKSQTLKEHREKIVYISRKTDLNGTKISIEKELESEFPNVYKLVNTLNNRHSETYSDGERAIFSITHYLSQLDKHKVLIIDELISNIYEDEEIKLRSEVVKAINKIAQKTNAIVIIVDHVITIPEVQTLRLTENGSIKSI